MDVLLFLSLICHPLLLLLVPFLAEEVWRCSKIDYFPTEDYSPDPNDSTMAIPCEYMDLFN